MRRLPRRLPIYLLLDCSESMAIPERIQSVESAARELHNELMGDPFYLECAFISVITFNSEQIEVFPLKELAEFEPPKLKVSGTAALGVALELVTARAESEKTTEEQRGDWSDWKPWVFIMSAFELTDDWEKSLAKFKLYNWGYVVGCAVDGADLDVLEQITGERVVELNTEGVTYYGFKALNTSIAYESTDALFDTDNYELPPPPDEIQIEPT